jgi:RNA polymerase sigma factor (sigma-70 family)
MHKITSDDINFCDAFTTNLCKKCGRLPDDDAIQSGREGLCIAAKRYDPEKSDSFKGYATYHIRDQVYQKHYGFRSKDALDQKGVAEFDDFHYSMPSGERTVITKDLFHKVLQRATPHQRSVLREMFLHDKNAYELAEEFGKTHQSYDSLFQHAKERVQTHQMKREVLA